MRVEEAIIEEIILTKMIVLTELSLFKEIGERLHIGLINLSRSVFSAKLEQEPKEIK